MNENAQWYKEDVKWYLMMALGWWQQAVKFAPDQFALDQWRWAMDGAKRQYKQYQYWAGR